MCTCTLSVLAHVDGTHKREMRTPGFPSNHTYNKNDLDVKKRSTVGQKQEHSGTKTVLSTILVSVIPVLCDWLAMERWHGRKSVLSPFDPSFDVSLQCSWVGASIQVVEPRWSYHIVG
jgi:hypothetical protein